MDTFTEPQIVGPLCLADALAINTCFLLLAGIALCSCLLLRLPPFSEAAQQQLLTRTQGARTKMTSSGNLGEGEWQAMTLLL